MENKKTLTKALAITGTVLVWLPIIVTFLTSVIGSIARRLFRFDYLMPAELFPVALISAILLLWAALRAHSHLKLIGWGLGTAVFFLAGSQVIAVISGLASGTIEPTGLIWAVVITSIVLYSFMLIELGVTGILLVKKL